MRVDKGAALIHRADAVRVAVGGQAEVAHPRADGAGQRAQVLRDRLGMHAAKAGIHLPAHLGDLAAGPLQEGFDHAAPRAVHRIDHEALRVVGDDVRVDQRPQVVEVGGQRVELLDQSHLARLVEIHQVGAARAFLVVVDVDFHAPALLGQGGAAVGGFQLDAVVARRIMRGGDHHARDRVEVLHREGNGRCRRIRLGEQDGESVGSQDAGHILGIAVG